MSDTIIIHHANCPDGFGAAWLLEQSLDGLRTSPLIVAANYGDEPPDVRGADVFIVDFCYQGDVMARIAEESNTLVVLDHHESALGYIADSGITTFRSVSEFIDSNGMDTAVAILDMNRSGVGLVMEYADVTVDMLLHVEDRDLWRFNLPGTAEVFAAITSRPYTRQAWDEMDAMDVTDLIAEGQAIQRYRQKLIDATVATAWQMQIPTGHFVWVAACPYAIGSDVAGVLAQRDPENFAAYFVPYGDRVKFGLRSVEGTGRNVREIASLIPGGGGHPHAAGFEVGWKSASVVGHVVPA